MITPKITPIPTAKEAKVKAAILAEKPIDQIEDPNDPEKLIDKYTFDEHLQIIMDKALSTIYNRGFTKIVEQASERLKTIF